MYDTNFNAFLVQRWLLLLDLALAGDRRLDSGAVVLTFMVHGSIHTTADSSMQAECLSWRLAPIYLLSQQFKFEMPSSCTLTAFLPGNIEFLR